MWPTGGYSTPLFTQVLPTQPLAREADNFPKGGKYFNYVPLLK